MSSDAPLNSKLPAITKAAILGLVALSIVGFAIATYLSVEYWRGVVPPCSVLAGCDAVLSSKYAAIGAIPVAAVGMFYYLALIILAGVYLDSKKFWVFQVMSLGTALGFIFSVYLVYLQLFVIKAICLYCLASAIVSFLLLVIDIIIWRWPGKPALHAMRDRHLEQPVV